MAAATTTITATSRKTSSSSKHTPVPLLLQSFPAPPSFIPPSPNPATALHACNPPPSLPPSSPLPPVPGPSPLSDHDALLFLSSGRASRASVSSNSSSSRRASNISFNHSSTNTRDRDSVLSSASRQSSVLSASPNIRPGRDSFSSRSTRSLSGSSSSPSTTASTSASSAPPRTPSIALSISEKDDHSTKPATVKVDPGNSQLTHPPLAASPEPILVSPDSDILPSTTALYRTPRKPSSSTKYIHHPPSAFSPPRAASRSSQRSKTSSTKKSSLMSSTSSYDDQGFDFAQQANNESIADIKLASEDDDSDLEFVLNHSSRGRGGEVFTTSTTTTSRREGSDDSAVLQDEENEEADVLALHRSIRATRSRSGSHRLNLAAKASTTKPPPLPLLASSSGIGSSSLTPTHPHTAIPITSMPTTPSSSSFSHTRRSSSPDIKEIIATTPKPSKSRSKSRSRGSRASSLSASTSGSGFVSGSKSKSWGGGVRSTVTRSAPASRRSSAQRGRTSGVSVNEFGVMERGGDSEWGPYSGFVDGEEEVLERALEGVGSDEDDGRGGDSDSSLDLHTPLPHLMVRHGMLSPNSKLLPQASATPTADGRPGSVASVTTTLTKSGLIKDERDTPQRRTRHRDGRMLRGGIGLTTGLGWSDSEDEDAPSALTRRLSTLNLSRRSSSSSLGSLGASSLSLHSSIHAASSLRTSAYSLQSSYSVGSIGSGRGMHPLAKSYSSEGILFERDEEEREDEERECFGMDEYAEVYKSFDYPTRMTTASSTLSISKKTLSNSLSSMAGGGKTKLMMKGVGGSLGNRDKHLPPLPPLSRQTSLASVKAVENGDVPPVPSTIPTNRTSAGSTKSPGLRPTTPSAMRIPRPLQLPRHSGVSATSNDRPAVPVPSVASLTPSSSTPSASSSSSDLRASSSFSSGLHSGRSMKERKSGGTLRSPVAGSGLSASMSTPSLIGKGKGLVSPVLPSPSGGAIDGEDKPKPRTGTGMVYRSSGAGSLSSRMRMPSAPMMSSRTRERSAEVVGGQKDGIL